jgi:hypothetical protein
VSDSRPSASSPAAAFREHYRRLLLSSAARALEGEQDRHVQLGHERRARSAERQASELRRLELEAPSAPRTRLDDATGTLLIELAPPSSRGLRRATLSAWLLSLALLCGAALSEGLRSWWTGACDLSLVALTFAWFWVGARDAFGAERRNAKPDAETPVAPAASVS